MWDPNEEHRKESLKRVLDPRLPNPEDPTIMETMKLALDCVTIPSFHMYKAVNVLTQIYNHLNYEMCQSSQMTNHHVNNFLSSFF